MDNVVQYLSDQERSFLFDRSRERRFARGEVVFHQHDPGDSLHLVRRGRLAVILKTARAKIVLDVAGQDALIGEMAMFGNGRRSATVTALEATTTREIRSEDFTIVRQASQKLTDALLAGFAARLGEMTDTVSSLFFASVEERLTRELAVLCDSYGGDDGTVVIPISQGELGDLVGATRQTVNRALAELRSSGVIASSDKKKQVTVLDPRRLRQMAAKIAQAH